MFQKIAIEGVLCFADVCMLFVINHEHFHLTFYKPFIILLLRCTCTTLFNISKLKTTTFSSCVIFFYCFRINACNKNLFMFLSHNKHLWIYLDVGGPNLTNRFIQNCIYSTYGPQNAKKKKPHKKQRTKNHLSKRIGLVLGIKNERYKRLNEMIYRGCSYTWTDLILHVCMCRWKILRKYIHIYISNLFRCIYVDLFWLYKKTQVKFFRAVPL